MLAAIARKGYDQRRERQAQGITKAKEAGLYLGRPIDENLHRRVREFLAARPGCIKAAARYAKCSTTTVLKIRASMVADDEG